MTLLALTVLSYYYYDLEWLLNVYLDYQQLVYGLLVLLPVELELLLQLVFALGRHLALALVGLVVALCLEVEVLE